MGEINIAYIIIQLIGFIALSIPIIKLFYAQGRKDQILDEVVKDVNGLGKMSLK